MSKGGGVDFVNHFWFAPGFSVFAEQYCAKCVICMNNNTGRGIPMPVSAYPTPEGPFEHVMMDFIELSPCLGYKYCGCLLYVGGYISIQACHSNGCCKEPTEGNHS